MQLNEKYERYECRGVALDVRTGVYNHVDKYAVQEVQDYPLVLGHYGTVIDAGAHIGAFTCWILHLVPDVLVLALEPEPGNFALLVRNIDDLGAIALNQPLSYDKEAIRLIIDLENSGGHRLGKPGDVQAGEVGIKSPDHCTLEELMVGEFEHVDLLKMDIEGSEMDVLLNAEADTLRRIGCIVGERHFTHEEFLPVIQRLETLGFAVEDGPHPVLSEAPWLMTNRGLFTATNRGWR